MQAETTKTLRKIGQTAERLIAEKIPHYERMPLLRNEAQAEGIYFNDKELLGVVASARQRLKGKSDGLGTGQEIYIPEESWAWDDVIAARTLNLLVALPKVGKSALIAGFISAWKYGSGEFLGHKINGSCPPVIIVGPDQSLGDWSKILFPAGLMRKKKEDYFELVDPIVKLWSRGDNLALDDEGIERIVNEADKHENPFVFADAFAKLISPLGQTNVSLRQLNQCITWLNLLSIRMQHWFFCITPLRLAQVKEPLMLQGEAMLCPLLLASASNSIC